MRILRLDEQQLQDNLYEKCVELYIQIYSDPPYNEVFHYNELMVSLRKYLSDLFLVAVDDDGTVVGFLMASRGWECDQSLANDLYRVNISHTNDIYLAELGVRSSHRRMGIAKSMLDKMFEHYQNQTIFLRTAKDNNDRIIRYYENLGFQVTSVKETVTNLRSDGTTNTDVRLYMVKYHQCLH